MPVLPSAALERCLDLLRCPVCRTRRLSPAPGSLGCPLGHTFDIARHGYLSLLGGTRATSGDDAAMVRARARFLSTGAYQPIRAAAARLLGAAVPRPATVLDVGCGTGHYLAGLLDQLPGTRGLGLDTSVPALRRAARAHARAAAATWDVFRPFPLAEASFDAVLNVFAPRNPAEFHRVLRPAGHLLVIRPTGRHLAELRGNAMLTIDPAKEHRLHRGLNPFFEPGTTERVEYPASLTAPDALSLRTMTPSPRTPLPETTAALPDRVTVSVLATVYRAR